MGAPRGGRGTEMGDNAAFETEVRDWLEQSCPASMRGPAAPGEEVWGGREAQFHSQDARLWLERCAERGYTVPTWPREYGGGGLDAEQAAVLAREMARIKARPPILSFGIWMLGPVLLEYGTEEQKREHLPQIAQGRIRWCQGYSEPGSGSDLASLRTKCEDGGDHFLVNGHKVWTSYADKADWIFCLVRTGPLEPKHEGISFLLIDMASPGVSTKPITLISGASPFCETLLEDVRVPKHNLVGEAGGGWTIAKRLLQFERNMISGMGGGEGGGAKLEDVARNYRGVRAGSNSELADAVLRHRIARHRMRGHAFGLTLERARQEGGGASALSSMFKLFGTEHNKSRYELLLQSMGSQALGWDGPGYSEQERDTTRAWLRSKANSIEGGTSEVQLNVIARRVLGLPTD